MKLPTTTLKFTFYFVRQQWFKFCLFFLFSITWAINDAFFPYFLKKIVNQLADYHGEASQVYSALAGTLTLLIAFWFISEIMQRLQGILQIYTFPQFRANIRQRVFDYVKSHSHEYFASHFAGNIAKRLADLPNSCQMILEIIFFQFATAVAGTILVLIMMYQVQPIFAYILLAWVSVHIGLSVIFLSYCNYLWEDHSDAVTVLSGKIVDTFTSILNVRLFARGKFESDYLRRYQRDEMKKAKKAMWAMELIRVGLSIDGLFLILAMVFTLIHGYIHHWVTLGDFTQVGMQAFWLLGWIWFISFQLTLYAREAGTISNALSLVRKGHDIIDVPGAKPLIVKEGKIEFKDVTFYYSKRRGIFKNFNLTIPAGQKIGLVGFSGSGKSTFVNLILRFYDIQSGKILIDEQNIAEVTQDSLRSQIAMIPQDPSLFHRSIMENIRYGRLDATDEEVFEAAKLAHCQEFIEKLEDGYQALVGERGIKLSGGQRQRIAIARAILKNAPILILDEATSALDTATEKLIQESLHHLMRNRTTIVVAHRLSTLTDMDRILVFHKGSIIEDGTKNSLLKNKGHFAMLWSMQTDGFLPQAE